MHFTSESELFIDFASSGLASSPNISVQIRSMEIHVELLDKRMIGTDELKYFKHKVQKNNISSQTMRIIVSFNKATQTPIVLN